MPRLPAMRNVVINKVKDIKDGLGNTQTIYESHLFTPDTTVALAYISPNFKSYDSMSGRKLIEKVQTVNMYSTLGFLLIAKGDETGDYEEALAFNRKAYDYDDGDASIVDNLAQVLYRTLL